MLQRRLQTPYAVYVHGEELNVVRTSRELTWMARRVLRSAQLVIANSRNTARLLENGWPIRADQIQVLHPGVDTQWFHPAGRDAAVRSRLGWEDRRVILSVGRLQKRKGHDNLLRALPEIRQAVPDVLYAIAGDGPERSRLAAMISDLGLRDCVSLHGELHCDDLRHAYQQCDLFVLPNREVEGDVEGFGMVLLEAQSCGKAVIAGDSGGTAEAVNSPNSGLIVDCREPVRLADTIRTLLLDDRRRTQMGAAGRRWVVEHFDWNALRLSAGELFACASQMTPKTIASAGSC
jgi:phosphatidylinositol alpha-1,6-mannosyltransferase